MVPLRMRTGWQGRPSASRRRMRRAILTLSAATWASRPAALQRVMSDMIGLLRAPDEVQFLSPLRDFFHGRDGGCGVQTGVGDGARCADSEVDAAVGAGEHKGGAGQVTAAVAEREREDRSFFE